MMLSVGFSLRQVLGAALSAQEEIGRWGGGVLW